MCMCVCVCVCTICACMLQHVCVCLCRGGSRIFCVGVFVSGAMPTQGVELDINSIYCTPL